MALLMVALMTWIAAHSRYSAADTLPDVVAMTQADFELYLCEQMEQCDAPMPHVEILARFDFESRTIYVVEGFDPRDLEHQSAMVHQLVHSLQALAGRSGGCRAVLVQEARQIENRWRTAHGLPPLPDASAGGCDSWTRTPLSPAAGDQRTTTKMVIPHAPRLPNVRRSALPLWHVACSPQQAAV